MVYQNTIVLQLSYEEFLGFDVEFVEWMFKEHKTPTNYSLILQLWTLTDDTFDRLNFG